MKAAKAWIENALFPIEALGAKRIFIKASVYNQLVMRKVIQ